MKLLHQSTVKFLAFPVLYSLAVPVLFRDRQLRSDKRGCVPDALAPILVRLGIQATSWCDLVSGFGKLFKRAAGRADSIANETARRGQAWMQAPGVSYLS